MASPAPPASSEGAAPATRPPDAYVGVTPWLIVALWSVPALLSSLETATFARVGGRPIAPWRAFVAEAPQWYVWALLTPFIARLGARFPLRRPLRASHVAVHVSASVLACAAIAVIEVLANAAVRPSSRTVQAALGGWFLGGLAGAIVAHFSIVGASTALRTNARLREREREAGQLATELRSAQLAALRMQLQPHFLFNSLNAIMALVRDVDTAQAVRALSLLGDVLRASLHAGDAHETTLEQEIDFVQRYLEIERVRFGDRLQVTIDVPEALLAARVPTFVLQPFVENALKHGVLRERGVNSIVIRAAVNDDGMLRLVVRDDGGGLGNKNAESDASRGVGIANARARLERMYGGDAALTVADATDGPGVLVDLRLPRSVLAGAP